MADGKGSAIKGSGKKGGTVFPRISLADAAPLAKKLVSKTHVTPQPADIILPGVFGSSGPHGQIKASALKQYHLLEGKSDAYVATGLAKKISAAPAEELMELYAQACLAPKVFGLLYQTFHGDTVTLAKLKQQAAAAAVHPDFLEDCVNLFAKSIEFSGLGKLNGDTLQLVGLASEKPNSSSATSTENDLSENDVEENPPSGEEEENDPGEQKLQKPATNLKNAPPSGVQRAIINVNVTLDSSLDTEKLERQLALLRKYGAL